MRLSQRGLSIDYDLDDDDEYQYEKNSIRSFNVRNNSI